MMVKSAVGFSTDLIKDILLAVQICLSQGGFAKLINQKEPYIKGVSFTLVVGCRIEKRNYLTKIFENHPKKPTIFRLKYNHYNNTFRVIFKH